MLVLLSPEPISKKWRALLINLLLGSVFLVTSQQLPADADSYSSLGRLFLLWAPLIFFWWAYLWAKKTLHSIHPPDRRLDEWLIDVEARLGQPSLWWARRGNRATHELFNAFYFSYYFYTPAVAIYLHLTERLSQMQAMTAAVCLGYLVSYTLFALLPAVGPRWSLCDEGLLSSREQELQGFGLTRFINWMMYRGPAHKGGAMPSSHSSTAVIFIIWSFRAWDGPGLVIALFLVLGMWVGSVYGRYHFVTDLLVGALLGLLSVWVADYFVLGTAG